MSQLVRDLFVSNVTRDIPPVVYFHEQSPVSYTHLTLPTSDLV